MEVKNASIDGVFRIVYNDFKDERGEAGKVFCQEILKDMDIDFKINDLFYSISKKNTIRGMHFQTHPFEQQKLVYVIQGEIIDVVIDLRKNSNTYKKYEIFNLRKDKNEAIFIPPGCAHGFKSICDDSVVMYAISGQYDKAHDTGVRWNSFGYDWGDGKFIVSERDKQFLSLDEYCNIQQ